MNVLQRRNFLCTAWSVVSNGFCISLHLLKDSTSLLMFNEKKKLKLDFFFNFIVIVQSNFLLWLRNGIARNSCQELFLFFEHRLHECVDINRCVPAANFWNNFYWMHKLVPSKLIFTVFLLNNNWIIYIYDDVMSLSYCRPVGGMRTGSKHIKWNYLWLVEDHFREYFH